MPRWEPDAPGRLGRAALDLYGERGFENTTVAEIAERAGLTERTFFRHFADKREVLFGGGTMLQDVIVGAVTEALDTLPPIEAVMAGLEAAGTQMFVPERRQLSRQRQKIIDANTDLQERELIKLASLAAAVADTLRRHGVDAAAASLMGEIGRGVFHTAFQRWIRDSGDPDFAELVRASFEELKLLTA